MSELKKAELAELSPASTPKLIPGTEIPVQFNPSSMRLQMTNSIEGGKSRGRQVQQYNGTSSTVLSLDLVFDTADEGDTGKPRNVREKTMQVARFVLPKGKQTKQAPPRVRFHWGDFIFDGVMTSLTEDIDLFSSGGVPLRAKVSISIKEQDPKFEALKSGAGANLGEGATKPGGAPAAPGTAGGGPTNRTGTALGGESAADFASRMGLDPAAWRGIAAGIEDPLSLQAGLNIDFDADLSVSAGVGLSAGVDLGVSASVEASIGLDVGASVRAGGSVEAGAGFALTAAGGVGAAIGTAQVVRTQSAAAEALAAFDVAGPSPVPPLRLPDQPRPSLQRAGVPTPAAQVAAPPAPGPPQPDSRAVSFGFGVPLRPRVAPAAADRAAVIGGRVVVGPRPGGLDAPPASSPVAPPWDGLPSRDPGRAAANRAERARAPSCPCGCSRRGPARGGAAPPCGPGGGP